MYYKYKDYDWNVDVDLSKGIAVISNDLFSISYKYAGVDSFKEASNWLKNGRPSTPLKIGEFEGMEVVLCRRGVVFSVCVMVQDQIVIRHDLLLSDRKSLEGAFGKAASLFLTE